MGTLREFLLARILDEETVAQAAIDERPADHAWTDSVEGPDAEAAHAARWNPWRVLSSCVAKRLIMAAHRDVGPGLDRRAEPDRALKAHACSTCGQYDEYAIEWPCYTLRVLALEWVDHPDYRVEWRPQRLSSGVGRVPPEESSTRATVLPPRPMPPITKTASEPAARPTNRDAAPGQPAA